ncbi:hypothetical protein [Providencia burhodogranariea]|uniref:Uncharacterized protein n=1 Tax=Providencia burhodogranariea DSM 19968 TaxID=1141662 RepID=K8WRX9_9GAMM|nr:hypothetical protein OOA_12335 [Providencia burhodogranariea DSM 19968]
MQYTYNLINYFKVQKLVFGIVLLSPTIGYAHKHCDYVSAPEISNYRELANIISLSRAYFYSAPYSECRRDDFVIFNDNLVVLEKGKDFSYAVYLGTNSKMTSGFVKNENLSKVELALCINENDFTVNVHNLSFKLNEPTSTVKRDVLASTGQDPSLFYIGQNDNGITSFALDYKYNDQVFIYLSALNSEVYNLDEETITQMNFNIPNQFTSRGVGIGSYFNDVLEKYGHCGIIERHSGSTTITYNYFEKSLIFTIEKDKVIGVTYLTLPWSQIKF